MVVVFVGGGVGGVGGGVVLLFVSAWCAGVVFGLRAAAGGGFGGMPVLCRPMAGAGEEWDGVVCVNSPKITAEFAEGAETRIVFIKKLCALCELCGGFPYVK